VVGTVRRDCLDWTLIWNERQLYRVLTEYLRHYNTARPHRALDLQPPAPAAHTLSAVGGDATTPVVERVDVLDGLIHEFPAAPPETTKPLTAIRFASADRGRERWRSPVRHGGRDASIERFGRRPADARSESVPAQFHCCGRGITK
jgi:Integrase core domain